MTKEICIGLCLLCLSFVAAAEFPLRLEYETVVPPHAAWDAQFYTNDTTLALVWINSDTIAYSLDGSEPFQVFVLPEGLVDSNYNGYGNSVSWLKLEPYADHPCILWHREYYHDLFFTDHLFCIFDLQSAILIDSVWIPGDEDVDLGFGYRITSTDIVGVQSWPLLPEPARWLAFSRASETHGYAMGDFSWDESSADLFVFDVESGHFPDSTEPLLPGCGYLSWFRDNPTDRFAFGGNRWHREGYWGEPPVEGTSEWMGIATIDPLSIIQDTTHGPSVLAQRDADGQERVLSSEIMLDAISLDTLWCNAVASHGWLVVRTASATDEFIVKPVPNRNQLSVYRASDGSLAGWTTIFMGHPHWIVRLPSNSDALLTTDRYHYDDPLTLRVYRFLPPVVDDLTCLRIPGTAEVELRWSASLVAAGYRIYSGAGPDDIEFLEAELPPTITTHRLAAGEGLRYYQVVSVLPQP